MKRCTKCGETKSLANYTRHAKTRDGFQCHCRQCISAQTRAWAAKNKQRKKAAYAARYASFRGWCRQRWSNLRLRCEGRMTYCAHIYAGLPYCSWEEFWTWAQANKDVWDALVAKAQQTGLRRDRPSIDRTDTKKGYVTDNMTFMAQGDNTLKALGQMHNRKETK